LLAEVRSADLSVSKPYPMKHLLVAFILGIATSLVVAQTPPTAPVPPLISTTGGAQIRVVPDLADLCFEVQIRGADLSAARKEQTERATKVLAALRGAGVTEAELQSSQVQIHPDYTDRRQESDKVKFYNVSQRICCTLHDVKKVPEVTANAIAAGVTGVSESTLRTSQLRKYRDEARAKAVRAAKEKAVALATELGAKVGKPYTITESPSYDWRGSMSNNVAMQSSTTARDDSSDDNATASFAPGAISITANVTVSFLLE
jgi:uncharacterized protein